jgi:multicomponent K+:H+ antiporter subunit E
VKRLLPAPLLSAVLWVAWLLLHDTLAPGQVLLGGALAWALPLALAPWRDPSPRIGRPFAIARLALVVLRDIVVCNVEVARQVLGPESAIHPGFVRLPLALTDAHAITVLATIITMTPGTLSCAVAADRSYLLIHALHLTDEAALVADIKARYETPLREIFG